MFLIFFSLFRCASVWLHCLDSIDALIYLNFSTRIHFLLPFGKPNPDIEELVIERLKELHERVMSNLDNPDDSLQEALCKCIKHLSSVQSTTFQEHLFDLAFDLITESKTHVVAFMIMAKEIHALMKVCTYLPKLCGFFSVLIQNMLPQNIKSC